jgi:hypothetical protein
MSPKYANTFNHPFVKKAGFRHFQFSIGHPQSEHMTAVSCNQNLIDLFAADRMTTNSTIVALRILLKSTPQTTWILRSKILKSSHHCVEAANLYKGSKSNRTEQDLVIVSIFQRQT